MHRYCRLFLPSFSQFFQPFEVAQTLKKSGRPHELRQGRARRTDGHFCPFTAVFLACFPVLCRYGQARAKIIPQAKRNARKKFFQNCAYFGLASTAGLLRASQYLARLLGAGSFALWPCVPRGGLCVALWRSLWPVVWLCLPSSLGARAWGSGGLVRCALAGYLMARSMWWLKRSPSLVLIVCSIVSRALPSII